MESFYFVEELVKCFHCRPIFPEVKVLTEFFFFFFPDMNLCPKLSP